MKTPYKVLGAGVATMLGRQSDLKKILGKLGRETPEHTSVIGAKYIGKTVFLNAVAQHFEANKGVFDACVYWDISRYTPSDDAEFFKKFASQIEKSINDVGKDYKEFFEKGTFETLKDVFEDLQEKSRRILIVIDNLDKLLQIGHLSRDAWDNLRTLGELSSVWFVTGSRKRLRELIGSPEVQGSPFWNLFGDTPMILRAFGEEDWSDFLAPFDGRKIVFVKGANAELDNYTGGMPILASAFCMNLWEKLADDQAITNETVVEMSKDFVSEKQDILKEIWNGCGDEQGIIEDLANERIDKSSIHQKELTNLENNGIVLKKNGKVCRLMKEFLDFEKPQVRKIQILFGKTEDFEKNIKRVLQLRLDQIKDLDSQLQFSLQSMVSKMDQPTHFVREIRGLVDRAFVVVWSQEFPDGQIPETFSQRWRFSGDDNAPSGRIDRISGNLSTQCYLLDLLTNVEKHGSTRISRAGYLLMSFLKNVGDFGQHLGNYSVLNGFVFSVCLSAIEMCELITKDLSKNN